MYFEPTEEQRLLLETTQSFLADEMSLGEVRRLSAAGLEFDRAWWSRAAAIGWTRMLVPEDHGGAGQDLVVLTNMALEAGRAVAPGPLISTNAVLAALARHQGHTPESMALLDAIVAGEAIATWAVCEPGRCGWQPASPKVTAEKSGGGYRLTGVKDRVESAGAADAFMVTAALGPDTVEFLVPSRTEGVAVTGSPCIDIVRRYGVVAFHDVWLPPGALVADPDASALIAWQAQLATVLHVAETVGAADRVFEFTLAWLADRYSFGRPLGSYQSIKHRMAKRKVELECMHAILGAAVLALAEQSSESAKLVSAAKSYAGDAGVELVQDCIQLHGAIGITWEHDIHLYLRRVALNRGLYGTPEDHRQILAGQIAA